MPLRLVELIVPASSSHEVTLIPDSPDVIARWDDTLGDERLLVRMLISAENAEEILDALQRRFSSVDDFRVMLLPVEATLPRPVAAAPNETTHKKKNPERISREELYSDVADSAKLSRVFVAQVVIATLVAAVGLMRDDTAVIVGAMVIAPLLGPNVSLCLATTLGDSDLARRSLKTNAAGLAIALACSVMIGLMFPIDPALDAIDARTNVSGGDIILALASGCAGVLAFTTGASSALIGVMVAVALLPPFAVFGLLLAAGEFRSACGALLLVATNVICVNLSGVLTFAAQGVRPRTWWEAERAEKGTRTAIATWLILLVAVIVLIVVATR